MTDTSSINQRSLEDIMYFVNDDVVLRPLTLNDALESLLLVNKNRSRLSEWLPWVESTVTVEDEIEYIKSSRSAIDAGSKLELGLFAKAQNVPNKWKLAGMCGFVDITDGCGCLGYWLDEDYIGKGIVTSACKKLIQIGVHELKLKRIKLDANPNNMTSIKVAQRLGFESDNALSTLESKPIKSKSLIQAKVISYQMTVEHFNNVSQGNADQ